MSQSRSHELSSEEDGEVQDFIFAPPGDQVAMLEAWSQPPAVALVLFNACANRCFFCAQPGTISVPEADVTGWDRISAQLWGARPEGVDRLMVGGNEPTLHPLFERLMAEAGPAGFREVDLMTSGMALADLDALDRWVALGLHSVVVPLYAPVAEVHDDICGTTCFDVTVAGLEAARARGVTVHVHTLALRRNVDHLEGLATWVHDAFGGTLALAPLREKDGLFQWDAEALTLAEVRRWLAGPGRGLPVTLLGWPSCVDRSVARGSAQLIEMYFRTQLRQYAPACEGCMDRQECLGVVQALLDRVQPDDLVPRRL